MGAAGRLSSVPRGIMHVVTRRWLSWLIALLVLWLPGTARVTRGDAPLLGLVLVTVDTLRADHVGPYGGAVPTPAFETLAREGVLVDKAYTPTPTTSPAHASLLTGLHPWRHRVLENAVPLAPGFTTLAEILRGEGFDTAAFVSSYVLHARFGLDRGFDHYEFEPTESYAWRGEMTPGFWARGGATTERALRWLNRRDAPGAGRFFKWIGEVDQPGTVYQLDRDPAELAASRGEGASQELREAATILEGVPKESAASLDPEARRAQEALGYAD